MTLVPHSDAFARAYERCRAEGPFDGPEAAAGIFHGCQRAALNLQLHDAAEGCGARRAAEVSALSAAARAAAAKASAEHAELSAALAAFIEGYQRDDALRARAAAAASPEALAAAAQLRLHPARADALLALPSVVDATVAAGLDELRHATGRGREAAIARSSRRLEALDAHAGMDLGAAAAAVVERLAAEPLQAVRADAEEQAVDVAELERDAMLLREECAVAVAQRRLRAAAEHHEAELEARAKIVRQAAAGVRRLLDEAPAALALDASDAQSAASAAAVTAAHATDALQQLHEDLTADFATLRTLANSQQQRAAEAEADHAQRAEERRAELRRLEEEEGTALAEAVAHLARASSAAQRRAAIVTQAMRAWAAAELRREVERCTNAVATAHQQTLREALDAVGAARRGVRMFAEWAVDAEARADTKRAAGDAALLDLQLTEGAQFLRRYCDFLGTAHTLQAHRRTHLDVSELERRQRALDLAQALDALDPHAAAYEERLAECDATRRTIEQSQRHAESLIDECAAAATPITESLTQRGLSVAPSPVATSAGVTDNAGAVAAPTQDPRGSAVVRALGVDNGQLQRHAALVAEAQNAAADALTRLRLERLQRITQGNDGREALLSGPPT